MWDTVGIDDLLGVLNIGVKGKAKGPTMMRFKSKRFYVTNSRHSCKYTAHGLRAAVSMPVRRDPPSLVTIYSVVLNRRRSNASPESASEQRSVVICERRWCN